ncbi:Serine/threonine-protein kinase mph1, partial [Frankliniella fusca]
QVSWLTSLLHADILSSRFDQQANQSWKLGQAGVELTAPLEDLECFFGNLTLLDVPPSASCHQDGPISLDELRQRPGGETQDKTC